MDRSSLTDEDKNRHTNHTNKVSYNSEIVRQQFPFLKEKKSIHYLDSAATSQKPTQVVQAICNSYIHESANVHRGVYALSEAATQSYENCRDKTAEFLGGVKREEVIFTSGTTHAINLVSRSFGEKNLQAGDEILLSIAEHHSNIVPWQIVAKKTGAQIKYIPLNEDLRLDMDAAKKLVSKKTKIVACAHVSNVLGVIHPVKDIITLAKSVGAISVIDGAQAVPHFPVNVRDLDCDFYCFSSHKMLGPTGLGVLYGRFELLESMDPFLGGGDMISHVSLDSSTWNSLPYKFEAGTPPIAQVHGFQAAMDFLNTIDREKALEHDRSLGQKIINKLQSNRSIQLFCKGGDDWVGIVTFFHSKIHPHDMAAFQDSKNVCVRAGHHCAQPLMNYFKVPASTRVSPFIYNNDEDVEQFLAALDCAEKVFQI